MADIGNALTRLLPLLPLPLAELDSRLLLRVCTGAYARDADGADEDVLVAMLALAVPEDIESAGLDSALAIAVGIPSASAGEMCPSTCPADV